MSHTHDVRVQAGALSAKASQTTAAEVMTEFSAEEISDLAGSGLAFDPLDTFEDLYAELDTGAATPGFTTESQAINAYFDTPFDDASAAAADIAHAATPAPRKKKQRNLVNARNAQRRFRERQKACVNADYLCS